MAREARFASVARYFIICVILAVQLFIIIQSYLTQRAGLEMGFLSITNFIAISFGPVTASVILILFNFFFIREMERMKEWIYLFIFAVLVFSMVLGFLSPPSWDIFMIFFVLQVLLMIACYIVLSRINPSRYRPIF